MGKEMKRFLVFCSLVNMLAINLFAESLNAQSSKRNGQEATMNNQTGFSLSVPSEYTRQASQRGSVTRLDYTSKDYAGNGKAITKTAYVYTPYGYNEKGSERYDILYLMHGWGGHAGEYFEMAEIKNVLIHLTGDIVLHEQKYSIQYSLCNISIYYFRILTDKEICRILN
jgi:enterochelin esterase-like enzyme